MVDIEQWKLVLKILKGELDDQLDELIKMKRAREEAQAQAQTQEKE